MRKPWLSFRGDRMRRGPGLSPSRPELEKNAPDAAKKARGEEDAARVKGTMERIASDLAKASAVQTAAVEELSRRGRMDEQRQSQIRPELESTQAAIDSGNKLFAAVSEARASEIARMKAELEKAAAIYATASGEISRRARLASL